MAAPPTYQARLTAGTTAGTGQVVIMADVPDDKSATILAAITDGRLAGFAVTPLPMIAASDATGIAFVAPTTGQVVESVGLDAAARGMSMVTGIDKPTLYVALADRTVAVVQVGEADGKQRPILDTTFWMPGDVSRVLFDEPTGMVHVLGLTPDGGSETIYVVEPHANAVYADARLPFNAAAWAIDTDGDHPSIDRQAILGFTRRDPRVGRHGPARLRLAAARGAGRRAHRGVLHLPACSGSSSDAGTSRSWRRSWSWSTG